MSEGKTKNKKQTLEGIKIRLNIAKEKVSEYKEIQPQTLSELKHKQKKKVFFRIKGASMSCKQIHVSWSIRRKRKRPSKKVFEEILNANPKFTEVQ